MCATISSEAYARIMRSREASDSLIAEVLRGVEVGIHGKNYAYSEDGLTLVALYDTYYARWTRERARDQWGPHRAHPLHRGRAHGGRPRYLLAGVSRARPRAVMLAVERRAHAARLCAATAKAYLSAYGGT